MTEPVPTDYDIIQDDRLDGLEELVHPYYQPPSEIEHSFPVVGQGVSSEMFQQISRAAGTGVYVQHDAEGAQSPYRLVGMPGGDAETNATNQMMLRTSNVTGRSESAISGFFHTQLEDMPISFPAVSSPTTYYLALTYDPRREEEPQGPIRIEVHTNDLPTTHGRKHVVLYTLRREPNQLLTQATITRTHPWLGHVINVWWESDLPDPTTVEYGTLAVVINPGGTPDMFTNRGVHGWVDLNAGNRPGPWQNLDLIGSWGHYSGHPAQYRVTPSGLEFRGRVENNGVGNLTTRFTILPEHLQPPRAFQQRITVNPVTTQALFAAEANGDLHLGWTSSNSLSWIFLDGLTLPL